MAWRLALLAYSAILSRSVWPAIRTNESRLRGESLKQPAVVERIHCRSQLSSWLLHGRLALFDHVTLRLEVYNETAATIWILLADGPSSLAALGASFAEIYGLTFDQASQDVEACVSEWIARGWVQREDSGTCRISEPAQQPGTTGPLATSMPAATLVHQRTHKFGQANFSLELYEVSPLGNDGIAARVQAVTSGFPTASAAHSGVTSGLQVVSDGSLTYVGDRQGNVKTTTDTASAYAEIVWRIFHLAHPSADPVGFFHAAALGKTRAVIFPGVSGSGKTTLSAYLAHRGWGYYGDDTIGLSLHRKRAPVGVVLPMPTALSVKDGSLEVLRTLYPSLSDLSTVRYGGKTVRYLPIQAPDLNEPSGAREVAAIVFPAYTPGMALRSNTISPVEALSRLIASGMSLQSGIGESKMEDFLEFMCSVPSYELNYSDLQEAESWLGGLADN